MTVFRMHVTIFGFTGFFSIGAEMSQRKVKKKFQASKSLSSVAVTIQYNH